MLLRGIPLLGHDLFRQVEREILTKNTLISILHIHACVAYQIARTVLGVVFRRGKRSSRFRSKMMMKIGRSVTGDSMSRLCAKTGVGAIAELGT